MGKMIPLFLRSLLQFIPMVMRQRLLLSGSLFAVALLGAGTVHAQKDTTVDFSLLQYYYTQEVKGGPSASLWDERIASERQRIRSLLTKEVDAILQPAESEKDLEPAKAIDRQRQVVDDLTGRLNESTVDLNLLKDEEKLYRDGKTGSGTFLMTKSYPELLARRVVLEETSDLLSAALSSQQTRLQKLLSEEKAKNITLFLSILSYLAIMVGVIWGEHFIRTQLILRIPHGGLRYALAKVFTMVVYLSLLFWIIQRVYAEYPGFTTVFAVIGAALVFMLQDVIKSFLGWLTYKGSLKLGDRVTLGGSTGDVLDISMLYTTILASRSPVMDDVTQAGKIIRVPNSQLLVGSLVNYHSTSDFENAEVPVYLGDPRQVERACKILEELLQEEAGGFAKDAKRQMDRRMRGFYFSQVSPSLRVYVELTEKRETVCLLSFPVPIGQRRAIVAGIVRQVLQRFEEEGIALAKPA